MPVGHRSSERVGTDRKLGDVRSSLLVEGVEECAIWIRFVLIGFVVVPKSATDALKVPDGFPGRRESVVRFFGVYPFCPPHESLREGSMSLSGNIRVLHHIIASTIMPGQDREKNGKALTGYAPGMGPDTLPAGAGIRLKAGARIIFQLHYTASGKAEKDRSRLGLYLAKEPPKTGLQRAAVIDYKFRIPPGAREFTARQSRRFDKDVLLYTMNPRMHFRGKWMRYSARYPDGTQELLLSVPNYRFDRQRNHELKESRLLPKGTELVVEAAWDNSPRNLNNPDPTMTVGWGDQTFNKMSYASYRFTVVDAKVSVR